MVSPLADHWSVLRHGTPGRRFRDRYHRTQRTATAHGWFWRIFRLGMALIAVICGVVMAVIPGPASVFFVLAGALLASDWLWVARVMDWAEVKARAASRWLGGIWRRLPIAARVALIALGVGISAASSFGFYRLIR